MTRTDTRLDASLLSPEEQRAIDDLAREVFTEADDERPALVGRDGVKIELPEPLFHLFVHVLRDLRAGQSVVILSESQSLTTQAAADYLGVSRPFLIGLLEKGEIPFHTVGTHRRVSLKDLMAYDKQRRQKRRKILDGLREEVDAAGLY